MGGIKTFFGIAIVLTVLIMYGANGLLVEDETSNPGQLINSRNQQSSSLSRSISGGGNGNSRTKAAPGARKGDDYSFFDEIAEMFGMGGDDTEN
ncbi:MAG: hypothetical protein AAF577_13850 [Pseudomonadota bacterium]